jgi:predicted GH43/DUF377 family glycosyl hydrolase
MKTSFILIIFSLIIFNSCTSEITSPPVETLKEGHVSLKIDKENAPTDVVIVEAFLSREGYDTLHGELNILASTSADILFEEIPVGLWHLKVNAMNTEGVVVYSGETEVTILDGILTQVNLVLNPTGSGVGKIYIYVTWGNINIWYDYINNPILSSMGSQYDLYGVAEPIVLKDGDKYLMWYLGVAGSARKYVFYAESFDGITWTLNQTTPVLYPGSPGSWDSWAVHPGAVIKDGGIFKMYYPAYSYQYAQWHIGLATSTDGIHWEKYPEPVLYGTSGWQFQIGPSSIIKVDGTYYLYFYGRNYPSYSIGVATSTDGIHWTKYTNNPILLSEYSWEGTGIYYPSVIKENDQFKMIYMNASADAFGIATSTDGIHWTKTGSNPFFKKANTADDWAEYDIAYPHLMKIGTEYRIYYSGIGDGASGYQIGFMRKFGN